jgi:hypothetical protein
VRWHACAGGGAPQGSRVGLAGVELAGEVDVALQDAGGVDPLLDDGLAVLQQLDAVGGGAAGLAVADVGLVKGDRDLCGAREVTEQAGCVSGAGGGPPAWQVVTPPLLNPQPFSGTLIGD